jgi:hypothetical protein
MWGSPNRRIMVQAGPHIQYSLVAKITKGKIGSSGKAPEYNSQYNNNKQRQKQKHHKSPQNPTD